MPKPPKLKMLVISFGLGLFCAVTLFPGKPPVAKTKDADVSLDADVYSLRSGSQATRSDG